MGNIYRRQRMKTQDFFPKPLSGIYFNTTD